MGLLAEVELDSNVLCVPKEIKFFLLPSAVFYEISGSNLTPGVTLRLQSLLRILFGLSLVLFGLQLHADPIAGESRLQSGRSPWTVSFFDFASVNRGVLDKGDARLETYNYLSFNYRLSDDQRLAIRPAFTYSTAGMNSFGDKLGQEVAASDLHFNYSNYDLGANDYFKFSGSAKMYLPTSKFSQESTLQTRLAGQWTAETLTTRGWKLTYNLKPEVYWFKDSAYKKTIKTSQPGKASKTFFKTTQNKDAGLEQIVDATWFANRDLGLRLTVGFKDEWYQGSDKFKRNPYRAETFKWGPGFDFRLNGRVSFIGGIENSWPVIKPRSTQGLLKADETVYYLMTFARI
jgi:hypothetical protein